MEPQSKLDLRKLEGVKHRADCVIARCPACAEAGRDSNRDHLKIDANGGFVCFKNAQDREHSKRILALAGLPKPPDERADWRDRAKRVQTPANFTPTKTTLAEIEPFRLRRGLSAYGIRCAVALGVLKVGVHSHYGKCVALRENGWWQARPLNAERFRNGQKTMSAPGKAPKFFGGSWLGDYPNLVLVEGPMAWLEAVDVVTRFGDSNWGVLAAYNAETKFADALPILGALKGRNVVIVPDNDLAGLDASERWEAELEAVGIENRTHLLPEGCADIGKALQRPDAAEILAEIFQTTNPQT